LDRVPPPTYYYDPPHVLRLVLPWISFEGLLDTAFEQIRHYSQSDAAVSLRLLRAYDDVGSMVKDPEVCSALLRRAERVVTGCTSHLPKDDLGRLQQRLAALQARAAVR
jgi:uncharacterized membrane protein